MPVTRGSFTNAPPMCCLLDCLLDIKTWQTGLFKNWAQMEHGESKRVRDMWLTEVCSANVLCFWLCDAALGQIYLSRSYFFVWPMTKFSVCLITGHRIVSGAWWSPSSPGHLRVFPNAWILQGTSHFPVSFCVIVVHVICFLIFLTVTWWTELWFLSHGWCN